MNRDHDFIKYTKQNRPRSRQNKGRSYFKTVAEKARGINGFYVLSGVAQMLLGFIVTLASLLHLVQPIWLAAFLSLLGCVVSMFGLYQVYDTFKQGHSAKDLARHAIERAIRDRN